jgi:Flp pilus assembly protein protease CpaA
MNPQAVVACVVGGGVLVLAGLMLRKRSDRSDS